MSTNPLKDLMESLEKLVTEHGSAAILRERLALVKEQAEIIIKQNEALKKENAQLKELGRDLQAQLMAKARVAEFVEYRGAAFKPMAGGGYEKAVFCPECHRAMFSLQGVLPYSCTKCKTHVDFTGNDLAGVMAELPPA